MFIPKGTVCTSNIWHCNHDRTVFGEDADEFRPEASLRAGRTVVWLCRNEPGRLRHVWVWVWATDLRGKGAGCKHALHQHSAYAVGTKYRAGAGRKWEGSACGR